MDSQALIAFVVFIIVMTGTPGPGNLTFMAIGAAAGYRAAFPVIVASQIGSLVVKLGVGFGLGHLMANGGVVVTTFKIASMLYMSYLAWRIVSMTVQQKETIKNPNFYEGLLIHPLSPKTWAMDLVAYTTFLNGNGLGIIANTGILALGFIIGGFVFHSLWAFLGVSILKIVGDGFLMRSITILMAIAMLGATFWALIM